MMARYRTASILMHAAVVATNAARPLGDGQVSTAVATLFRRSVAQSLWALIEETPKMRRQARRRKRAAAGMLLSRDRGTDCKGRGIAWC